MTREIPLSNAPGQFALVDDADYERVSQHTWYLKKDDGYVRAYVNGHNVTLHNFIKAPLPGKEVDHRDCNPLNCTTGNLRHATKQQQAANRRKVRGASRFKGVWRKGKRWRACTALNGKTIHLGYFANETDAARAYDAKARELFGEFARPNFPNE